MATKTTPHGRDYEIDGRRLTWHPEDDDGVQGNVADVTIPLRIKLGLILDLAEEDNLSNTAMAQMLERIIPNHMETLREMDVNDFQDMFLTWQREYNSLTGASLGESSASDN